MPDTLPLTGTAARAQQIGRNVAAELRRHQVTQADAADELHVSRQTFHARLHGKHGGLTAVQLDSLALMLGVPVESFHARPVLVDRDTAVDREAGHLGVGMAVAVLFALLIGPLVTGVGHVFLWAAGLEGPWLLAALVGIALTGFPLYALAVVMDGVRRRQAQRAAVRRWSADEVAARKARTLTNVRHLAPVGRG